MAKNSTSGVYRITELVGTLPIRFVAKHAVAHALPPTYEVPYSGESVH